jgi:hypothetical protein
MFVLLRTAVLKIEWLLGAICPLPATFPTHRFKMDDAHGHRLLLQRLKLINLVARCMFLFKMLLPVTVTLTIAFVEVL